MGVGVLPPGLTGPEGELSDPPPPPPQATTKIERMTMDIRFKKVKILHPLLLFHY